jgi:hypothetical protein
LRIGRQGVCPLRNVKRDDSSLSRLSGSQAVHERHRAGERTGIEAPGRIPITGLPIAAPAQTPLRGISLAHRGVSAAALQTGVEPLLSVSGTSLVALQRTNGTWRRSVAVHCIYTRKAREKVALRNQLVVWWECGR